MMTKWSYFCMTIRQLKLFLCKMSMRVLTHTLKLTLDSANVLPLKLLEMIKNYSFIYFLWFIMTLNVYLCMHFIFHLIFIFFTINHYWFKSSYLDTILSVWHTLKYFSPICLSVLLFLIISLSNPLVSPITLLWSNSDLSDGCDGQCPTSGSCHISLGTLSKNMEFLQPVSNTSPETKRGVMVWRTTIGYWMAGVKWQISLTPFQETVLKAFCIFLKDFWVMETALLISYTTSYVKFFFISYLTYFVCFHITSSIYTVCL